MRYISEDYCSEELSGMLMEKGYIGATNTYLDKDGLNVEQITLQSAMKWLRMEHSLHCSIDYDFMLGWYCQITSLKETVEYDYEEMKHYHPDEDNGFSSPEEACEAAIKYCLKNLI